MTAVADPGFSRGGGAWTLQGGREHAKFSRKLYEIERIWMPRGGVRPSRPPLDPPMDRVKGMIINCFGNSLRPMVNIFT